MRPCTCNKITSGAYTLDQCRLCWLYHNDASYHNFWNEEPPSMLGKAINFTKAIVQHLAAGLPRVADEELIRRLAICNQCEFYIESRCLKCGCTMQIKASWTEQKCPIGKW